LASALHRSSAGKVLDLSVVACSGPPLPVAPTRLSQLLYAVS
jgi:hypothetical protein